MQSNELALEETAVEYVRAVCDCRYFVGYFPDVSPRDGE